MAEFKLIEIIRQRTERSRDDVALGIGDDAALLKLPAGQQLVACTDTLVAGMHFLHGAAPGDIGWKALAVNLSDLAAMGAQPAWAMLALTLPQADRTFVECFAGGFAEIADKYEVALIGGDTTQGPLSITVSAFGFVPDGRALLRSGARVGDGVFVTGTPGDAAGALELLRKPETGNRASKGQTPPSPELSNLLARLHRPWPRIQAGLALRGLASACIDVSDGLLADLGHVCEASRVGAEIEVEALPISSALMRAFAPDQCRAFALSGGDDYELCFTAPEQDAGRIAAEFTTMDCDVTRVGRIVAEPGVRVRGANGQVLESPRRGWQHFAP